MPARPRSPLHERIGRRVRLLRQARGMTQAELAEASECSNHFVSGIERGVDSPSLSTLETLARALGTTVGALVEEESDWYREPFKELARLVHEGDDPRLVRVLREVAELYRAAPSKRRR